MGGEFPGVTSIAYLTAGILFIRSLSGLSKQETARAGNTAGIIGMALAVAVATFAWVTAEAVHLRTVGLWLLVLAVLTGGAIGTTLARRVEMTGMPELVAMLHSFVGLAAVLVGFSSFFNPPAGLEGARHTVHLTEIWASVAVGAITFTGSLIAWGKLHGTISGKPLLLPGRHIVNVLIAACILALSYPFSQQSGLQALPYLVCMAVCACLLGVHLVLAIGGADMPVVVSLLNSYSGWAAAATGFMLSNDLLIVTGALVGSSGTILSIIMCRAMNRSILNVAFGGFGTGDAKPAASDASPSGAVQAIQAEELGARLQQAKCVVIVPGYGMAVSRAQAAVYTLLRNLKAHGVNVRFAIHPVAGRMPGHMNVLLAEAGVPYDCVCEMEDINADFEKVDVVLVIGANDIVNPGALEDAASSIYGMPVLEVWRARMTVVLKRGMSAGYAGVENPLFYLDNNRMLFGDARKSVEALAASVGA